MVYFVLLYVVEKHNNHPVSITIISVIIIIINNMIGLSGIVINILLGGGVDMGCASFNRVQFRPK